MPHVKELIFRSRKNRNGRASLLPTFSFRCSRIFNNARIVKSQNSLGDALATYQGMCIHTRNGLFIWHTSCSTLSRGTMSPPSGSRIARPKTRSTRAKGKGKAMVPVPVEMFFLRFECEDPWRATEHSDIGLYTKKSGSYMHLVPYCMRHETNLRTKKPSLRQGWRCQTLPVQEKCGLPLG